MAKTDYIFVNLTGSPLVLSLPNGSLLTIESGEGVRGEWFSHHSSVVNGFIPIERIPAGTHVKKIYDPLPMLEDPPSTANTSSDPQEVRVETNGDGMMDLSESVAKSSALLVPETETSETMASHVPLPTEKMIEGRTRDEWGRWFSESSDTTVLTIKASTMKKILLAYGVLDIDGKTKQEMVRAIRNHYRLSNV